MQRLSPEVRVLFAGGGGVKPKLLTAAVKNLGAVGVRGGVAERRHEDVAATDGARAGHNRQRWGRRRGGRECGRGADHREREAGGQSRRHAVRAAIATALRG